MNIFDKEEMAAIERLEAEPVNAARLRQPLYAPRKKIHPKRAEGYFRRFKWLVMLITLGIYYLAPWIRWDRGPHAPDQAILLDVAGRRFYGVPNSRLRYSRRASPERRIASRGRETPGARRSSK